MASPRAANGSDDEDTVNSSAGEFKISTTNTINQKLGVWGGVPQGKILGGGGNGLFLVVLFEQNAKHLERNDRNRENATDSADNEESSENVSSDF
jgi:galactokinase/mevalonate kinase-like predicted kinase